MSSTPRVEQSLAAFDAAWQANRLAQAYLVVGSIRDEALPFAQEALLRLFCHAGQVPCRTCPACRQTLERRHADIVWVEPEKKSRVVGIGRIRDLQKVVYQTSFEGGWKAVVLVGADRVGEEASNAFLKTLEEPPPRCLFLLLTDAPQAVMATIQSRCQRMVLSSEPEVLPEPWRSELLGILGDPVPRGLAGAALRAGRLDKMLGAMRQAVADDETTASADTEELSDETLQARIESRYRGMRTIVVRAMLLWYRDLLTLVCGAGAATLRYREREADLRRLADGAGYAAALNNIRVIETMQRQLDRNMPGEAVIQAAFVALSV